jgi:PAS domain S-box-containing protein
MTSSGPVGITGLGLEELLRYMPVAVMVVEAGSGRVVHSNARALEMTERQLGRAVPSELTADWEIFHPDGRAYRMEEWPLVRSMTSGEEVVDEEYFNLLADGSRLVVRCSSSPIYDDEGRVVAGVLVMNDVTERTKIEEHLGYLAGLLDNTDDAIVALDADWCLTVWNKGAERMYGWTADEVVGSHTLDVAQLGMSQEERAEVRRQAAEHGRWRGEVVAYRKDGTTVTVELITVALRGELGEVTGFLGIHRDISARKLAEQALREAQRRSETILESITDAFVAVDRDWRYTYVNDRALSRLETWHGRALRREQIIGRGMWELFPDAVGTDVEYRLRAAMGAQDPVEFELYFAPTDEWVETRAYPSASGLSIYYRNVTERKRAEEERERRMRQQARLAELGLRALATDGLQELMEEVVGLVAEMLDVELAGVAELVPGSEEIIFRAGFGWRQGLVGQRVGEEDRGALMDYTLRCREPVIVEDMATDRRFSVSGVARGHGVVSAVSVMIESPDEPFGTLGAFSTRRRTFSPSDVSFVQSVANVLASAVERSRARERLADVTDAERRRLARDLHDEALQELTDALVQAELVRSACAEPGVAEGLVSALKRVGQHLRSAIYDLRLDEQEDVPLPEQLKAMVALHAAVAVDCRVELNVAEGAPAQPLGRAGKEMLRIVGEALTNARRHSGAGLIRVGAWGSEEQISVEVSDDGCGFDPAGHPFGDGGTGIGGMRERASLLGANLEITSEPNAGTAVRLRLALTEDENPVERVRVLLVEDHAAVREAIGAMFDREPDFEVTGQAASLAEARGMLHDVDVAVVDLGLPDGYGGDLIGELREVNPHAQALVLSASLDHVDVARAIESGAAGTFNKTVHLDQVVDAVRRLRAGETLLPPNELYELLRFAGRRREQERDDRRAIETLTAREREVLHGLADGLDSQAIADRLHISIRTERNHIANILSKLGVHSQLQALVFALRYEVVEIHRNESNSP